MGRVADLIILNLLCIVCCIPIVTAGASITAMFYITLKMVRNEESYIVRGFFKSFKQNLKQGIVINIIMLIAAFLLFCDLQIVRQLNSTMGQVLMVVFMAFGLIYMMIFLYIYPVLSKFYNSIKNTFVNAFLMAIRHLIVTAVPIAILFSPDAKILSLLMMVFVLLGFSTVAYINSHFFVKIFDNYIPKEENTDDDIDSRLENFDSENLHYSSEPSTNSSAEQTTEAVSETAAATADSNNGEQE